MTLYAQCVGDPARPRVHGFSFLPKPRMATKRYHGTIVKLYPGTMAASRAWQYEAGARERRGAFSAAGLAAVAQ